MSGSPDPRLAVLHLVEYAGLLVVIGALVVRRLARLPPRIAWANPQMHLALGAALAGGLGLLAFDHSWWVAGRVGAEGVALGLCLRGRRLVAPFAVLAAVLLPFAGHAASVEPQAAGAEFADALHVVSAGMWAGGVVALGVLRPPGGWRGAEASTLIERFGRVAAIAFGVTALTGLLRATEQLHDVSDLWTTAYGLVVALKSAGVLAMLVLSAAWRRDRRLAALDVAIAGAVITATAVLAAFPMPETR